MNATHQGGFQLRQRGRQGKPTLDRPLNGGRLCSPRHLPDRLARPALRPLDLPREAAELCLIVTCVDLNDDTVFSVIDAFQLATDGFLHPFRLPNRYVRIEVSLVESHAVRPSERFDFQIDPIVFFTLDPDLSESDGGQLIYATENSSGPRLDGIKLDDDPDILDKRSIEEFLRRKKRIVMQLKF